MLISGGQLVTKSPTWGEAAMSQTRFPGWSSVSLLGYQASYAHLYRSHNWVFTVVNKRAKATARLPLKVYDRNDQDRPEADNDYFRLLRRPNPRMSPVTYWLWVSSMFDIYGEAIVVKVRDSSRQVRELWPLHPALVDVEERDGRRWYVRRDRDGLRWSEDDVIHHRTFNPLSTFRGFSPLEPLRQTLLNEDAARRATAAFWRNGARPGFALSHPGVLSDGAGRRLKAQFDAISAGVDNTGSTVVLEEGMKPEQLSLTAEEAQYIETRKLNREEVCAAYDMPPTAVGILDHATYSNITEQLRSVYRDTLAPHLKGFEADLEMQLRPDFGDGFYAEFLMDEVLRGDFETRTQAWATAIQTGQATSAEARRAENRPFIDGSDQLMVNAAMVPITQAGQPAVPATAVRTVMGRLSRVKTLDDIDADTLVAGLNGSGDLVRSVLAEARAAGDDVVGLRERIKELT